MRMFKCEEKRKVYNAIVNCSDHAKEKKDLKKIRHLEIINFTIIVDWINSLMISKNVLNIYNFYEEVKNGLIILNLIKIYQPEKEIKGIFQKPIKKKCALINLEKALAVVYQNNPYYYSLVSAMDIYEKKEKKIHFLFLYLFDKYEFQVLKKNAIQLLEWYNHTLKKIGMPISKQLLEDPWGIAERKPKDIINYDSTEEKFRKNGFKAENKKQKEKQKQKQKEEVEREKEKEREKEWKSEMEKKREKENNSYENNIKKQIHGFNKKWCVYLEETKRNEKYIKNFISYLLFLNDTVSNQVPKIYVEFADAIRFLLIFYRYGYISDKQICQIKADGYKNNNFMLQSLMRKLNIPILYAGSSWGEPLQVSILLQLKYIQCFIHNNGYEYAIDLKKNRSFLLNLFKEKNIRSLSSSDNSYNSLSESSSDDSSNDSSDISSDDSSVISSQRSSQYSLQNSSQKSSQYSLQNSSQNSSDDSLENSLNNSLHNSTRGCHKKKTEKYPHDSSESSSEKSSEKSSENSSDAIDLFKNGNKQLGTQLKKYIIEETKRKKNIGNKKYVKDIFPIKSNVSTMKNKYFSDLPQYTNLKREDSSSSYEYSEPNAI